MAFLIPENIKTRKDVANSTRRVASAFQIGTDSASTLWFEPLYDPSGKKPHFVLFMPDRGIVVMEVFETDFSGVLEPLGDKLE